MAVFNKNSLYQVSGFDNPIIAGELVWEQKAYWNLNMTGEDGLPVDLTNAVIDAQIVRRELSNVHDSRYGLTFDIADYDPPPTPINLTVTNVVNVAGSFTLVIDDSTWGLVNSDPELKIDYVNGVGFSGRIKISFAASGTTPAQDTIIFLLFIVRSDAIVKV